MWKRWILQEELKHGTFRFRLHSFLIGDSSGLVHWSSVESIVYHLWGDFSNSLEQLLLQEL